MDTSSDSCLNHHQIFVLRTHFRFPKQFLKKKSLLKYNYRKSSVVINKCLRHCVWPFLMTMNFGLIRQPHEEVSRPLTLIWCKRCTNKLCPLNFWKIFPRVYKYLRLKRTGGTPGIRLFNIFQIEIILNKKFLGF